jgi:hypothetical protein
MFTSSVLVLHLLAKLDKDIPDYLIYGVPFYQRPFLDIQVVFFALPKLSDKHQVRFSFAFNLENFVPFCHQMFSLGPFAPQQFFSAK